MSDLKRQNRNRSVGIHWGVYVCVNLALFLINFAVNYANPWHLYVLMGWGVGVLIHTAIIIVINFISNTMDAKLAIHASITMVLTGYLIWNDWFDNYRVEWVLFAVVPLVLIWLNHFYIYRIFRIQYEEKGTQAPSGRKTIFDRMIAAELSHISPGSVENPSQAARKIVMHKIILQNHIIIYAGVNTFLFILNLKTGLTYPWFLWPALSWGMNIFFHAFSYLSIKRKSLGQKITKKYLLVYPATVCIFLIFTDVLSNGEFNWFWWAVVPIVLLSLVITNAVSDKRLIHESKSGQIGSQSPMPAAIPEYKSFNPATIVPEGKKGQFCTNCGRKSAPHHQFCLFCGHKL